MAEPSAHAFPSLSLPLEMAPPAERAFQRTRSTSIATVVYTPRSSTKSSDTGNFMFLVVLYLIQGIPMGLTFGSIPFILKGSGQLSYTELGLFTLASYPYSLKLLWSPLVDSIYSPKFGRRKSWIVPVQALSGFLMMYLGSHVDGWLKSDRIEMVGLTIIFSLLMFLTATQDVAVDGWAISLLSHANRGYAATCQTIGLNTGYFIAFTVFLSLNSADFTNMYVRPLFGFALRPIGLFQLGTFIKAWGIIYLLVTLLILFLKKENVLDTRVEQESSLSIREVYNQVWKILGLPNMRKLIVLLLICKLGFAANDNVSALKLLDMGFKREHLAMTVMLDFPFQLIIGYQAARHAHASNPLKPWLIGYVVRLILVITTTGILAIYPNPGSEHVPDWYFFLVIINVLLTSCAATVMFVSLSAYFSVISDPSIGGTYMTLLNTFANLGGTLPQYFVMKAVDFATDATCQSQGPSAGHSCVDHIGKEACIADHGTCIINKDGFYLVSAVCVVLGLIIFVYLRKTVTSLESLSEVAWRVQRRRNKVN